MVNIFFLLKLDTNMRELKTDSIKPVVNRS